MNEIISLNKLEKEVSGDSNDTFKGWDYCYYCGNKMTDDDFDNYEPMMCCSGRDCGCLGLPTEPPYCIKCSNK